MTKIMLVEDDKSLREIYGVRLLAEGYQIISAGDGEEALAMAVKEKPDLILSDVMMPKISGFDMLDILRATPETKDIKVIMMTALSSEDQRARGEKLGANRYLVKSQVGIEDVVRTVHDLMADTPVSIATPVQRFGGLEPITETSPQPEPQTPQETPAPVQPITPQPDFVPPIGPVPVPDLKPIMEPDFVRSTEYNPAPVIPQPAFSPNESVTVEPPVQITVNTPQAEAIPQSPVAPVTLQPDFSSQLPQPTAPFSTAAPASLGDRIINPITPTAPTQDIAALMNQELNNNPAAAPIPPVQNPPQI